MRLYELREWQRCQITALDRVQGFLQYCLTENLVPERIKVSNNLFQQLLDIIRKREKIQIKGDTKTFNLVFQGHTYNLFCDMTLPDGVVCLCKEN